MHIKKLWILIIWALLFQIGGPSILANATQATRDSEDDIIYVAAKKRFHIRSIKVGSRSFSGDDLAMRNTYIAIFKSALVRDAVTKKPKIVKTAEELFLKQNPRLLLLQQKAADGQLLEAAILVQDSRNCMPPSPKVASILLENLATDYCVDMALEFPGGFEKSVPLNVTPLALEQRVRYPQVNQEFSKAVQISLEGIATREFIADFKKSAGH